MNKKTIALLIAAGGAIYRVNAWRDHSMTLALNNLLDRFVRAEVERDDLVYVVRRKEAEIEGLKDEIKQLKNQVKQLESTAKATEAALLSTEARRRAAVRDIELAKSSTAAGDTRQDELEAEIDRLKKERDQALAEREQARAWVKAYTKS